MKYKVGQTVEISENNNGHGFRIGQKVKITRLYEDCYTPHYSAKSIGRNSKAWWISDDEIKEDESNILIPNK